MLPMSFCAAKGLGIAFMFSELCQPRGSYGTRSKGRGAFKLVLDVSKKLEASVVCWYKRRCGCDDERLVLDSIRYGVESEPSDSLSIPLMFGANGEVAETVVNV